MATTPKVTSPDPLRLARSQSWWPVELVLVVVFISGFMLVPWMMAAYMPSENGQSRIAPGMTKKEVLVILGEPNERHQPDVCWNYDPHHPGANRFCVRFDELGKVKEVTP